MLHDDGHLAGGEEVLCLAIMDLAQLVHEGGIVMKPVAETIDGAAHGEVGRIGQRELFLGHAFVIHRCGFCI